MARPRVRVLLGLAFGAAIAIATLQKPKALEPVEWPGVDDAVIGRFVREAGQPPPQPLIEWIRGDLLLFAFLCAGLFAGFMLGFFGRALFVERHDSAARAPEGADRG
jgi:hypothetical protein